ncbi:MAG: hypothetical protein IPO93_08150 [Actinobacteria bacterium]|nr:hypothetical protein [Actinomycetota bacterium]
MDVRIGRGSRGVVAGRRSLLILVVALIAVVAVVVALVTIRLADRPVPGPQQDAAVCGWDLSVPQGVKDNGDYLTFTVEWLASHPGQTPPVPTSPFWRGPCPMPTGPPVGPPEDEHDSPDE